MRYRKKWNSIFNGPQFENNLPVKLSFPLEQPQKYILEVSATSRLKYCPHLAKFKKQKALPCKFQKKFKGPLFHCREILDHKCWYSGKNLSALSKSI